MINPKIKALAQHLSVSPSEIEVTTYDDNQFTVNGDEYLVLTDEEADQKCDEYIRDTAWAFRKEWLIDFMPVFQHNCKAGEKAIAAIQEQCETGNDAILALIDDVPDFVEKSIAADGRGHFLAGYDFEENRIDDVDGEDYYIYRTN